MSSTSLASPVTSEKVLSASALVAAALYSQHGKRMETGSEGVEHSGTEFMQIHANTSGGLAPELQGSHLLNRTGNLLSIICFSLGFVGISSSIAKRHLCLACLIVGFSNGPGDGRNLLQCLLSCCLVIVHPLIKI